MKKLIYLFFIVLVFQGGCKEKEVDCGPFNCLTIFTKIIIFPQNNIGKSVPVINIDAKNIRTGKVYLNLKMENIPNQEPVGYIVATDAEKRDFSEGGDKVEVTATTTTGTFKTELTISGGNCACGITKVSGSNILIIK